MFDAVAVFKPPTLAPQVIDHLRRFGAVGRCTDGLLFGHVAVTQHDGLGYVSPWDFRPGYVHAGSIKRVGGAMARVLGCCRPAVFLANATRFTF